MAPVNVALPADLVAQVMPGDPSKHAARLLALDLFRLNRVSLEKAAEFCAMPLAGFIEFAVQHRVLPSNYNLKRHEE